VLRPARSRNQFAGEDRADEHECRGQGSGVGSQGWRIDGAM
jgi:hypothetical protein